MPEKNFTAEQTERMLHVLALEAGRSGPASRTLAQEGIEITPRSLRRWRAETHAKRYREIAEKYAEEFDRRHGEDILGEARNRVETAALLNEKLREAIEANDTKAIVELATADRNNTTSLGILTDKNRTIRDLPTQLVATNVSMLELASELARLSPDVAKALGVLEVVDAEVVEEDDKSLPPAPPAEG